MSTVTFVYCDKTTKAGARSFALKCKAKQSIADNGRKSKDLCPIAQYATMPKLFCVVNEGYTKKFEGDSVCD